ncbi:hypothetical protein BDR22DRAFT_885641 [Usnea florida]
MPPDQDRLPLLPPPLTDDPPPFSSHPEYHTSPPPSTDTDTASVLPAYTPAKYRGHHATEEEYLAALRAWAEEKMYTQPADKSTLVGFYGQETMKERIARQPPLKCLEECGSLSSETGIIECSIRLPCNHLVGSHCLVTWFHHNNSCPICRREFFSAPLRPRLENETARGFGDVDDDDDGGDDDDNAASSALSSSDGSGEGDDSETRLDRLLRDTRRLSHRLHLVYAAEYLAQLIAQRMFRMDALLRCRPRHKAAVSNFVAANLVHHHRPLDLIGTLTYIGQETLLNCYRMFYPERETVINGEVLFLLREDPQRAARGDLPVLDWPLPDFTRGWWYMIADRLETQAARTDLIEHSRRLFLILVNQRYLNAQSSSNVAALSILLASCLGHTPTRSCGEIASAVGVNESDVRTIYALFYPHRQDLLEHRAVDGVVGDDRYYQRLVARLHREVPPPVEGRIVDS